MSKVAKHPAELFVEAKSLDPDLADVLLEYELDDAALLVSGDFRILLYIWDADSAQQRKLHEQVEAEGGGIIALLHDEVAPEEVRELVKNVAHFDYMEPPWEPLRLVRHLRHLLNALRWEAEASLARDELQASRRRLKEIQDIGIALSAERDLDRLLNRIVEKARQITLADAGSLYIIEDDDETTGVDSRRLRFKVSQNDSIIVPFSEFTIPIGVGSIAGYVAATSNVLNLEDVYHLPEETPFQFNRSFDEKFNYRSKSMLVVPLINRVGDLIGVLQLINRKRDFRQTLDPLIADHIVLPFSLADVEVVESLASAAAVALENAFLYEEIHGLFEGFVKASVGAIESRDPTTSGHSGRVAKLTVGLAEKVDRVDSGAFRDLKFSREQIREMQYASLLHDFGKIGVKEEVLVKAEKLYPGDYKLVRARFQFIEKDLEAGFLRKQNQLLFEKGKKASAKLLREYEEDYRRQIAELRAFLQVIDEANRPSILAEGNFETLQELAKRTFRDIDGSTHPLLTEREVVNLSLSKGSLNIEEREQIESHVTHTFQFLKNIPWTKELRRIPRIAYMHHEKLNGRGYPTGATAEDIPVQSRMMTISDIYDALTASDRPYKKAVPVDKALDIIGYEVKDGLLDEELYKVFIESKVYRLTHE